MNERIHDNNSRHLPAVIVYLCQILRTKCRKNALSMLFLTEIFAYIRILYYLCSGFERRYLSGAFFSKYPNILRKFSEKIACTAVYVRFKFYKKYIFLLFI